MSRMMTTGCMLAALVFAPVFSSYAAISLLQTFSEQNLTGSTNFGVSVSSAGDVNNDSYADVIVGANAYNANTGRAYIYYGGASMNNTADVTITGEGDGSRLGSSVACAGDVNKDGYVDVIVGAWGYNAGVGRAYVFYGGSMPANIPAGGANVILPGQAAGENFGRSVSGAGDVNADGFADVIVGAYYYSTQTGRAFIYYGSASMDATADVTMIGEGTNNRFGVSVSNAGDINKDGYADVVVGASINSTSTGRAYVYYGGAPMNNAADVTMSGEATSNFYGYSVSGAGDVNSDGFADVLIGAYGYSSSKGRAYIYFGSASMDVTADITMTGEATANAFGKSVSNAGDVNKDGYADVVVGADAYSTNTGRAYIYYGGASMNNAVDVTMAGEATSNFYGYAVSEAGDVNADGYADVIVGAYGYNSSTGRANIYYGGASMNNAADVTMSGEGKDNYYGYSVSDAGDVNADGYADVIVGAYGYNSSTGRAYVYYGGASMNSTADVAMTGEVTGNSFGYSVSGAGDVNNDTFDDVIVGAFGYGSAAGRAYVYFGGSSMNSAADITITGEEADNNFGNSVSGAGNVNNDAYDDIIVGEPGYSTNTGRARIYFGGNPMNTVADVTMIGEAVSDNFGNSVSGAGDVNNDGYQDVVVGAYEYNSETGSAYLYFGGNPMNTIADVTMTGAGAYNNFGFSVSGAGDVNSDNFADVIVGEPGYSSGTGRVTIYFGGAAMNNGADVTMIGAANNNDFGYSVSAAGDVNKDGVDDVIIGESGYSDDTGQAYIYYGGNPMNNTIDVTLTGEGINNKFGYSVSGAGDVNNDGSDDVIIGAYTYPINGKAYLYAEDTPIAVNLSLFTAQAEEAGVLLLWETQNESNFAGYHVYRRQESAIEFVKINEAMILSQGTPSTGAHYQYVDVPPARGNYIYKLQSINLDGSDEFSEAVSVSFSGGVGQSLAPTEFALRQNYPNPFNPQTTIRYDLPVASNVTLVIYDARGRHVRTLINDNQPVGVHNAIWDGRSDGGLAVSSGLYIYRINAGEFSEMRKMTFLK